MVDAAIPYNPVEDRQNFPLDGLPKSALQAIYHEVTGKTESLTKHINGNVVINSADIDRLYHMIIDQLEHFTVVFQPTVTVKVKCYNSKSITYSSWERYNTLRVNNHDMTSELILRLEFVIQLPNTTTPQRCVVNVALDSSLPVMPAVHKDDIDRDPMSFFMLFGDDWRTVIVSIDFVDFLVAKTFQTTVEEWFNSLNKTPRHKFSILLLKNYAALRTASFQFGRIGMAIFLVVYIFANNKHSISLAGLTIACAIAMLLWSAFLLIEAPSMRNVNRNLSKNIIPSVILLNDKDQQIYEDVLTSSNSGVGTILGIITMIASSVALNVLASYLYSWMSGK